MQEKRVLIADDHVYTRAGAARALEGNGFTVCAEAADCLTAVEAARREQPDICLLDIFMPGSGIVAARMINTLLPGTAIVMLTVSMADADLFESIRAGAIGYLLKDTDPGRLPMALEGVLAGEAAIPRRLMVRILDEFRTRGSSRTVMSGRRRVELTNREWDILELLSQDLTTAQVAARLDISAVTVRRHTSEIMRKLRVPTRGAAVTMMRGAQAQAASGAA